jgi:hypothetical protein
LSAIGAGGHARGRGIDAARDEQDGLSGEADLQAAQNRVRLPQVADRRVLLARELPVIVGDEDDGTPMSFRGRCRM